MEALRKAEHAIKSFANTMSLAQVAKSSDLLKNIKLTSQRQEEAFRRITPLSEPFIGAWMAASTKFKKLSADQLMERQRQVQTLYETRFASMQRLVAFFVLFHEMGKRVQDFWPAWTMGYLGYRIDRTHSIMRIATTASPVSGAEVRDRINYLSLRTELEKALAVINGMAQHFKQKSVLMARLAEMKEKPLNVAGAGIEKLIAPKSAKDAVREVAAKPPPTSFEDSYLICISAWVILCVGV